MYDESQSIVADYLLRHRGIPLAILEAKAEGEEAADGMQQASRYAQRLSIRFSIASNGNEWILTDNESGDFEHLTAPPSPEEIMRRHGGEIDWERWEGAFSAAYHVDQVHRKLVRPYQDMAIFKTLWTFARGRDRALLLKATGTGKTFTVFQLIWKLMNGGALPRQHVLFLTDRNSLKDQAFRAFSAFPASERVTIDRETVKNGQHEVGKIFFANYQNLDDELDGKKLYEHYDPDFFDLVVIDECHRSGFGDWFGMLEYFGSALQLGLTATPRELEKTKRPLTSAEQRRDTYHYFGEPIFTYTLRQAIEDGFLVPYLLEERITNIDAEGFTGPDGTHYTTSNFERDIRMPDRTRAIAKDLWSTLGTYGLRDEKTIVFCVDDTHAAFMAAELRRLSGDPDYAARVTRSERNSHQLERNFAVVDSTKRSKPRIAVTVDLLSTGFDAPDVKNIVFVRPLHSAILYKQMKGRGTRLCEDIDKRYFTIFDYSGASTLEDAEFDGHPANSQKPARKRKPRPKPKSDPEPKPIMEGVSVFLSDSSRYICFADGRKIPFEEYTEQSREHILDVASRSIDSLLEIWIDKKSRQELREDLRDHDIHPSAFRHYLGLDSTDDVDILAKIAFRLVRVPTRHQRVDRFWARDENWLRTRLDGAPPAGKVIALPEPVSRAAEDEGAYRAGGLFKREFWQVALDHYALFGIDDLEKARTYSAPQFADQFGSFQTIAARYGSPQLLKADLEAVKQHLYVPMAS